MTLTTLNKLNISERFEALIKCCGSTRWASELNLKFPFSSLENLLVESDSIWKSSTKEDLFEAFSHHPKIGDVKSLQTKFASTKDWASKEQSGVAEASILTIQKLSEKNIEYEKKFGFIFIICATGKKADEMLEMLELRFQNNLENELVIAASEQNKITRLRLIKLLS